MIYLDYAATTKPLTTVIDAIAQSLREFPGNPSSIHPEGFKARKELNRLKESIAQLLGTSKNRLLFASSGTEANNLIIQGRYFLAPQKRYITTLTEHPSVLKTFEHLQTLGADVVYLPVDEEGFINPHDLKEALKVPTALVSVLYANNETGVVQDIPSLIELTHQAGALFHTDMVQVWLHKDIHLDALNPDFATFSAHKFMGPKGVGLAYVKEASTLKPHTYGGRQENQLRAGTENIAYIAGFLKALEDTKVSKVLWEKEISQLAHYFTEQLSKHGFSYTLNGPPLEGQRFNSILNLSFKGIDAQDFRFFLNQHDVYVSLGSACDSQSVLPSHVLTAMFSDADRLKSAIRFSLGPDIKKTDLDDVIQLMENYIKK